MLPCSTRKDYADLEKYNSLPLLDIQRSVLSIHGYTAMYKSGIFKPYLQNLMSNILHIPSTEAAGRDQTPSFVCVKPDMEQTTYDIVGLDPLGRCVETGVTSFWVKDTVIVFLCPSFLDLASQPVLTPGGPKDVYCPVVRDNVFVGQSDPLVRYQNYDLVHQLAHLYLQKGGLTGETVPKEVMDWNSCVGLGWFVFPQTNIALFKPNGSPETLSWDSRAPHKSMVLTGRNVIGRRFRAARRSKIRSIWFIILLVSGVLCIQEAR